MAQPCVSDRQFLEWKTWLAANRSVLENTAIVFENGQFSGLIVATPPEVK